MDRENKKVNPLLISTYILLTTAIIFIGVNLVKGQEITEEQIQQVENQQEIFGIIDPNRKQINKNIKTKDLDLAEDLSFVYGKLEYIEKICGR